MNRYLGGQSGLAPATTDENILLPRNTGENGAWQTHDSLISQNNYQKDAPRQNGGSTPSGNSINATTVMWRSASVSNGSNRSSCGPRPYSSYTSDTNVFSE